LPLPVLMLSVLILTLSATSLAMLMAQWGQASPNCP
jgi:hypothetical protein